MRNVAFAGTHEAFLQYRYFMQIVWTKPILTEINKLYEFNLLMMVCFIYIITFTIRTVTTIMIIASHCEWDNITLEANHRFIYCNCRNDSQFQRSYRGSYESKRIRSAFIKAILDLLHAWLQFLSPTS